MSDSADDRRQSRVFAWLDKRYDELLAESLVGLNPNARICSQMRECMEADAAHDAVREFDRLSLADVTFSNQFTLDS